VIGDVGSGKTSLLSSIIGDLRYLNKPFVEANIERKIEKDFIFLNEIDKESLKEISGDNKPIIINENIAYVQ
jgi:GTPase SAR1 family protein